MYIIGTVSYFYSHPMLINSNNYKYSHEIIERIKLYLFIIIVLTSCSVINSINYSLSWSRKNNGLMYIIGTLYSTHILYGHEIERIKGIINLHIDTVYCTSICTYSLCWLTEIILLFHEIEGKDSLLV